MNLLEAMRKIRNKKHKGIILPDLKYPLYEDYEHFYYDDIDNGEKKIKMEFDNDQITSNQWGVVRLKEVKLITIEMIDKVEIKKRTMTMKVNAKFKPEVRYGRKK